MHPNFSRAFHTIRPSIVGLGFSKGDHVQIIGTGFLISEDGWILTNRHVLEPLLASSSPDSKISPTSIAVLFTHADLESFSGVIGVTGTPIQQIAFPPDPELPGDLPVPKYKGLKPIAQFDPKAPDIGLAKIAPAFCHPSSLPFRALSISPKSTNVGTPVGILGFPQGLSIPMDAPTREMMQFTPLLQCGIISAGLPFSGLPNPEAYVIDIYVNGGSSGSPLFNQDGEVVGIVYATRQSFQPLVTKSENGISRSPDSGVYVPSSLGLAVPSTRILHSWLTNTMNEGSE